MEHRALGRSGLQVSRICLGCMSYGEPGRGTHPWSLPEDEAAPFFRQALDLGIDFFDTANVYSDGTSEEYVGRLLLPHVRREDVVVATKVHGRMRPGPHGAGLSRRAVLHELDASLRRLGTDYVDLYQIHRMDPSVPWEETLAVLAEVVRAGKVRYLGASSMPAWQFAKALSLQEKHGWAPFVSMQNHLNLLYREEEREMVPLCLDQGVGVLPYSPLARGLLTGTRTRGGAGTTTRSGNDPAAQDLYSDADFDVVDALVDVATELGRPPAQVALAWLRERPGVAAPVVGVTKPAHLEDALASLDLELGPEECGKLEAAYVPHAVAGPE
jgi:aryl-alcohol dehydrogenase (NADP+)